MKRIHSSKTGLFLIEMLFALAFFMLAAAICLQIFAKSHTISEDSSLKTKAAMEAQNIAEIWLQDTTELDTLTIIYPTILQSQDCYTIFYDSSWNPCLEKDKTYQAVLENKDQKLEIKVSNNKKVIYTMSVVRHVPYVR